MLSPAFNMSIMSSMPMFLHNDTHWNGVFCPATRYCSDNRHEDLIRMSGSHKWAVIDKGGSKHEINDKHQKIISIAKGILERGNWTLPSWNLEKKISVMFHKKMGWTIKHDRDEPGRLKLIANAGIASGDIRSALVSASFSAELSDQEIKNKSRRILDYVDSPAEAFFYTKVLQPILGYPLLDYLQFQLPMEMMNVGDDFSDQRVDFVLFTGRGLRLVMEIDGIQHQDESQSTLDIKRDSALEKAGWNVWRVKTHELSEIERLKSTLKQHLIKDKNTYHWGVNEKIEKTRTKDIMSCVWGATVSARIQFLLLEALGLGLLPWEGPWNVCVVEKETSVATIAIDDFRNWFGRIRSLFGETPVSQIKIHPKNKIKACDYVIDISIADPYSKIVQSNVNIGWSRASNYPANNQSRAFSGRVLATTEPNDGLIKSFVQDFFRIKRPRTEQCKIIARILLGQDVIGLLPTGGGKSLTYQLCGLLMGGLTIYVSPLKSLLQDQRERLCDFGIDLVAEISSSLNYIQKGKASLLLKLGCVRFLLIAPERFLKEDFRNDLSIYRTIYGEVNQIVVDECHCVSEWGHEFRPAYLCLSRIAKERTTRFGISSPLVALTGTASPVVLSDIQRELGIFGADAVIKPVKMDRPEIALECIQVAQDYKIGVLKRIIHEYVRNKDHGHRDGVLIFCRYITNRDGILAVSSELLSILLEDDMRFYCGESPSWKHLAAFKLKKKAAALKDKEIDAAIPSWACEKSCRTPSSNYDWDKVKIKSQRDFISGKKNNYRVLVATKAFGMGIDKPSIRKVIHYTTPESPEAYYQEVGRAGRDGRQSEAILLFSDEDGEVANKILDPTTSLKDAKILYDNYKKNNPFGGGDFVKTFYFHNNSFAGIEDDIDCTKSVLSEVRKMLESNRPAILTYDTSIDSNLPSEANNYCSRQEHSIEYSLIRLINLGIVSDYTKDYKSNAFKIIVNSQWSEIRNDFFSLSEYMQSQCITYRKKYKSYSSDEENKRFVSCNNVHEIEKQSIIYLINFIYDHIEKKRRQASRQMLECAREGVGNPGRFRDKIIEYLQTSAKYDNKLLELVRNNDIFSWANLLEKTDGEFDELKELSGACLRFLEDYSDHPGVLTLSSLTRMSPSDNELSRSKEEFAAALHYLSNLIGTDQAKKNGYMALSFSKKYNDSTYGTFEKIFSQWLIKNSFEEEAVQYFFHLDTVRKLFMAHVLKRVNNLIPNLDWPDQ